MKMPDINSLIEKYFDGHTSLEEERQLKAYFEQSDLPKEHLRIKPLFEIGKTLPELDQSSFEADFERSLNHRKTDIGKTFRWPLFATAAAIALLFFSLFDFNQERLHQDTFSDPVEAYAQASKALQFVGLKLSDGMNSTVLAGDKLDQGITQIERLRWINTGIETTSRLSEIDKTRNILNFTNNH